ncbi:hypothetical protein EDD22DRAFT_957205 [Suillus occidentalis]|nr:hypothetical protein EDD22DRAFT_957205 [Suillus occidentalis]
MKNKKLLAVQEMTKAAKERNVKISAMLPGAQATEQSTNAQYTKALEECISPISQFLDAVMQLTGWEWTVIGRGPDPRLGGMLNVLRYGNLCFLTLVATLNVTEKHLNPYLGYLATVFSKDDRKKRALDYIPLVVQDENTSLEDAAPTTSESAQSYVPFTLDLAQSFALHTVAGPGSTGGSSGVAVTGPPIIPQPQLNSQGPEFLSFNNGMYSFSGENSGTLPQLMLLPVLQMLTLPGGSFPSNST